ncbi:MAG: c-type cytochrome [Anaerolineales bacterium]|nr:c-type cytochrome [Anaerolineales bacterium]
MIGRVLTGTFSIVLMMVVLGYVAVTEQDRMSSFATAYDARKIETGAALYEAQCVVCHGPNGEGGIGPALNALDLINGSRLKEFGWANTTEAYIRNAIAAGRPRFSAAIGDRGQRMPTFGQAYGGPLRDDQVDALVAFVMNWGEAFRGPDGKIPSATATPNPNAAGTDPTIELPTGDAARGATLVTACQACHVAGAPAVGPAWESAKELTGKNIAQQAEARIAEAGYAGKATTAEQYLFESIVNPAAYIVAPYTGATWQATTTTMPNNYSTTLLKQDVADIIAYLKTVP